VRAIKENKNNQKLIIKVTGTDKEVPSKFPSANTAICPELSSFSSINDDDQKGGDGSVSSFVRLFSYFLLQVAVIKKIKITKISSTNQLSFSHHPVSSINQSVGSRQSIERNQLKI
jgi:hypothetical protein